MKSRPDALADPFTGSVAELVPPPLKPDRSGPPASAVPLTACADPEALRALVDAWSARHGYDDRRAAACQWSKYLFRALVGPYTVAAACGWPVPERPAGWLTMDEGVADRWIADWQAPGEAADPASWAGVPVAALAAGCGAPRRVLHANLANLVDAVLECLVQHRPACGHGAPRLRRRWLQRDGDGALRGLIVRDPDQRRVRRVCCLRYRLGLSYCAACPFANDPAPRG